MSIGFKNMWEAHFFRIPASKQQTCNVLATTFQHFFFKGLSSISEECRSMNTTTIPSELVLVLPEYHRHQSWFCQTSINYRFVVVYRKNRPFYERGLARLPDIYRFCKWLMTLLCTEYVTAHYENWNLNFKGTWCITCYWTVHELSLHATLNFEIKYWPINISEWCGSRDEHAMPVVNHQQEIYWGWWY